jgi:hypothetical protein
MLEHDVNALLSDQKDELEMLHYFKLVKRTKLGQIRHCPPTFEDTGPLDGQPRDIHNFRR